MILLSCYPYILTLSNKHRNCSVHVIISKFKMASLISIHTYTFYIHIYVRSNTYIHTYIIYKCTTCTYICTYVCMYTCTYIYTSCTYMHIYIHTHTDTHTYIHTCTIGDVLSKLKSDQEL